MEKHKVILVQSVQDVSPRRLKGYQEIYCLNGKPGGGLSLPSDFAGGAEQLLAEYKAGGAIDWVYAQYVKEKEAKILNGLFQDEGGHLFIKKTILWDLGKIFFSFMIAEKFMREHGKEAIDFIPQGFSYSLYQLIGQRSDLLPANVQIPRWYLARMKRREAMKNFLFSAVFMFYPLMLGLCMWGKKEKRPIKHYRYAIHVWDSWINEWAPPHELDFLKDQGDIHPTNTLYLMSTRVTDENLRKIKSYGYGYCYFEEMVRGFSRGEYFREIYPSIRKAARTMVSMGSKKALLAEAYIRSLRLSILWKIFYCRYKVDIFIFPQDPDTIPGTLLRRQHGSKNIFIYSSTQYDITPRENMDTFTEIYYGLLIFDVMISSAMSNDYFKRNYSHIGQYESCGVMLSDYVFKVRHDKELQAGIRKKLFVPDNKIIIGFFDCGVGRVGYISNEEGACMINDVYRLLESNANYHVIYRTRNAGRLKEGSTVRKAAERLMHHERVSYVNELAPHWKAPKFMGACDLVIGGFGSSIPLEAVVGGVKTVCYLPSERLNNDVFAINRFPRFCAVGYEQLKKYVEYWLFACTEEEFRYFQDAYIKKYVDQHCDGQAIQRLHAVLRACGSVRPSVEVSALE